MNAKKARNIGPVIPGVLSHLNGEAANTDDILDLERRMCEPLIPSDEKAPGFKGSRIDNIDGTKKYLAREKERLHGRINAAANQFLRENGYTWSGRAKKS